jgi:hypothetical protein
MPLPDAATDGTVGAMVSGIGGAALATGKTFGWFANALGVSTLVPWKMVAKAGVPTTTGLIVGLEGSGAARIRGSVDDPITE